MSNNTKDPVLTALEEYEQFPASNDKKAFLLTPEGGFFLYGNRFCTMQEYELDLVSKDRQIWGQRVTGSPLFVMLSAGGLRIEPGQPCTPALVSLIFHVATGADELLRGILLALGSEVQFSLFSDKSLEDLFRLARKPILTEIINVLPGQEVFQYAADQRQNDLRCLANLYLHGRPLKHLFSRDEYEKNIYK